MPFASGLYGTGVFIKILFVLFSFLIAFKDIKTGVVPRVAFLLAFPLFFVLCLTQADPRSPVALATSALLGLSVFILAFFISGRKLGLADVWYSALVGLVLGPWRWYAAVGCACVAGIIFILVSKRRRIPFIPLMALGSIAAIIFL